MTFRKSALVCALAGASLLALTNFGAPGPSAPAASAETAEFKPGTRRIVPGPNDGRIAFVAAKLLEQEHYLQHPLDDAFSAKFFERYTETLDPQHMHFTQGDLAELDFYRTNLDNLTITRRGVGDVTPAFRIYERFMQRIEERTALAEEMLKGGKFEFTSDERMPTDRRESASPATLDEAKQLWAQLLRFEYLQEKIARSGPKKKAAPAAVTPAATNAPAADVKPKTDAEEITELLAKRYRRTLKMFQDFDNDDVMSFYITALAHVYDPHSDYFNKRQADNFAIGMNLQLFGIGAQLKFDDGYCVIDKLYPGPAMKSKQIKGGDKVVAVAQADGPPVDIVEMPLNKAVQLIRGPKGTEVRVTIIPVDAPRERRVVSLVRDEIKIEDSEAKAEVIEVPQAAGTLRLGVVTLPSFYGAVDIAGGVSSGGEGENTRSLATDVAKLVTKMKCEKVGGIILDMRRNGGGLLREAVRLTGLFIKDGPVVQQRNFDGTLMVLRDNDSSILYDGPLVVLTDRFSASASEIVAGALQDYGRALVVGDISTHGKGTVQNVNPLARWVRPATESATNDPGELKLTISKFYRASGASTQLKGVMPDIVLPSKLNYSKGVGEGAMESALAWDTIAPVPFKKVNLVEPFLPALLKRSAERVGADKEYAYIREDIAQFRKEQADKTISLNERERLREKDENDARQKSRDHERLTRKDDGRIVHELRLADVEKAGLPAPVEKTNAVAKIVSPDAIGSATNTVASNTKPAGPADDVDEEKPPAVDAMLVEAEDILADYVSLLASKAELTANQPKP